MQKTSEWYAFVDGGRDAERVTVTRFRGAVDDPVIYAYLSRGGLAQPWPSSDELIEYVPPPRGLHVPDVDGALWLDGVRVTKGFSS